MWSRVYQSFHSTQFSASSKVFKFTQARGRIVGSRITFVALFIRDSIRDVALSLKESISQWHFVVSTGKFGHWKVRIDWLTYMQIYCFKRDIYFFKTCKFKTKTPLYHRCVLAVGKLKLGSVGPPRKVTSSCTQVPVDVESSPYSIQNGVSKYSMLKALKNQNSSHAQAEKCIRIRDPKG